MDLNSRLEKQASQTTLEMRTAIQLASTGDIMTAVEILVVTGIVVARPPLDSLRSWLPDSI
jgi:hypothetical protein